MWLADPAIEECGLLNVLRRPGTPLKVTTDEDRTRELQEGVDYDVVRDELLENSRHIHKLDEALQHTG